MNKNIFSVSGRISHGKDLVGSIIQYLFWKDKVEKGEKMNLHYTFNDFIKSNFPGNILSGFEIKKFADKLKDFVCILLGCTRQQLEDRTFKEKELGEEWKYYKVTDNDFDSCAYALFATEKEANEFIETCMYINPTISEHIYTPRALLQFIGTDLLRNQLHPNTWVNATFSEYDEDSKWILTDTRFPNELDAVKKLGGITILVKRNSIPTPVNEHESEKALDNSEFDHIINNDGSVDELIDKVKEILIKENII